MRITRNETRHLMQTGTSLCVTIPTEFVLIHDLNKGDPMLVNSVGEGDECILMIRPYNKYISCPLCMSETVTVHRPSEDYFFDFRGMPHHHNPVTLECTCSCGTKFTKEINERCWCEKKEEK